MKSSFSISGQIGRPRPRTNKTIRIPAPIKGIDTRVAASEGNPLNCVFAYNLVPHEQDLKVRKGYREYQIGLVDGVSDGVHTIIPFNATNTTLAADKLFAVTNEGIWDVTQDAATPVLKVQFPIVDEGAGFGNYVHYTNDAEKDVLLYADNLNGLYTYDAALDTWAPTPDITGVDVADIRFVLLHKDRLWFVVQDSSTMWYLDYGSIAGVADPFHMGGKMPHGGAVAGAFSWAVDTGGGLDAFLVVVSSAGDIVVFAGDNPSDATNWQQTGEYFVGTIPKGSTFGTQHGGNLYLLSVYGVHSMNDLLKGVNSEAMVANTNNSSPSNKLTSIIRAAMSHTIDKLGWEIRLAPSEGALIINAPLRNISAAPIQYVFSLNMEAWGFWRDVPIGAFDTWGTSVIFGTLDNRICIMDNTVDNELITPVGEVNGEDIRFSLLTSFQSFGEMGRFKQVCLLRPDFVALSLPQFRVLAAYDYKVDEQVVVLPPATEAQLAYWNEDLWDAALWSAGLPSGQNKVVGSFGMGRYVAVAMVGRTRERTSFVGFDLTYSTGGSLL